IYVAYNSTSNVFGGVTTFNNTPTANTGIYVSWNSAGTSFSNNIIVGSNNGQGVQFCGGNATATATLSAGNTISIGPAGFSSGTLLLRHFTQVGATPQSLTLTGTGNLTYGPSSSFDGNVNSSSPTLFFNGCTFNGTTICTKTGTTGDYSQGGNVFNGVSSITNSGTSFLLMGNVNADIWNNDVTFTDNGSERLLPCWATTGNQFNGNIYVNTAGSAQGIEFCGGSTTATATLAAGKSIQAGGTGLNAGYLILKQFTQLGNSPISLALASTATYLQFGPSSSLGGNVVSTSPGLYFNGCTFNGAVTSTKTGSTNDNSSGNNIFNGITTITDAGAGYLLLGNGNSDQFNNTAAFNNTGTSTVYVAYNSPNNIFGGVTTFSNTPGANTGIYVSSYSAGTTFTNNILVNSTAGTGVQFCTGNSSATATLNAGNTISVGTIGFTAGTLLLRQFTQLGATGQNITLTGTGTLTFGPSSTFNGPTTTSSPSLFFNVSTFNNNVNSTKTGTTNDQSIGNNIFNGTNLFTNNGTGYLMMSTSATDAYNGDVAFVKAGSGAVYPNYNANCTYSGNLTVTSPAASAITFGAGSGTATFTGSGGQNIYATAGTATPVFTRLVINNTGSGVTLFNTSINVSSNLTLTSGLLNTSTAYILTMLNGSATAAGTALSTSYVNGPMRYQKSSAGSTALNFPIGTAPDCRPVVLTVSHTNGTLYTYTVQLYNASAYALGYTMPPSVQIVSSMHYYIIGRTDASGTNQPTAGLSGNQTIQIFFGANDYVTDGSTLTIVKNTYLTPTKWIDIGGTGAPPYSGGADLIGSIISTSSPTAFNSFSTFALANRIGGSNVLPMKLLYFNAKPDNTQVDLTWETATESNNDYFTVEKSKDGISFDDLTRVNSAAPNGTSSLPLYYSAVDPKPYTGTTWYRLRQTDLNGNSTWSNIVSVDFSKTSAVSVYPNPSTGIVYIDGLGNNQSIASVQWFDLGGRLLMQQTASITGGTTRLTTHFNNGVYILRFATADGTIITKTILIMK
ncbi:MAG TPA: T9SS type A sorting domain-containing protein, partial [Puia sp.]|nr:T9SS type A sorting domain-containing protein [Puia sp.]